nr:hypothetical protein BaRGS_018510 [Batillaria attramentaria]
MKVIVCFDSVRVIVPCGDGEILVRELITKAIHRYKKATGKAGSHWVNVHNLKTISGGGILDPDDQLQDVCDDREQPTLKKKVDPCTTMVAMEPAQAQQELPARIFFRWERVRMEVVEMAGRPEKIQAEKMAERNRNKDLGLPPQRGESDEPRSESSDEENRAGGSGVDKRKKSHLSRFSRDAFRFSLSNRPNMFVWMEAQERAEEKSKQQAVQPEERKGPVGASVSENDTKPFSDTKPKKQEAARDMGLMIQSVEPGGRIQKDGRLSAEDRIVEINGRKASRLPSCPNLVTHTAKPSPLTLPQKTPDGASSPASPEKPSAPTQKDAQVNGMPMAGKTQAEVVTMLRNTPQGSLVSLLVSRQEEVDERFTVPRELDGRLLLNDQLLEVNGVNLQGIPNVVAMENLRRAMTTEGPSRGHIQLTVARRVGMYRPPAPNVREVPHSNLKRSSSLEDLSQPEPQRQAPPEEPEDQSVFSSCDWLTQQQHRARQGVYPREQEEELYEQHMMDDERRHIMVAEVHHDIRGRHEMWQGRGETGGNYVQQYSRYLVHHSVIVGYEDRMPIQFGITLGSRKKKSLISKVM